MRRDFVGGICSISYNVSESHGKEGASMKIVILRSPALLAPILRKMFGIRKEKRR